MSNGDRGTNKYKDNILRLSKEANEAAPQSAAASPAQSKDPAYLEAKAMLEGQKIQELESQLAAAQKEMEQLRKTAEDERAKATGLEQRLLEKRPTPAPQVKDAEAIAQERARAQEAVKRAEERLVGYERRATEAERKLADEKATRETLSEERQRLELELARVMKSNLGEQVALRLNHNAYLNTLLGALGIEPKDRPQQKNDTPALETMVAEKLEQRLAAAAENAKIIKAYELAFTLLPAYVSSGEPIKIEVKEVADRVQTFVEAYRKVFSLAAEMITDVLGDSDVPNSTTVPPVLRPIVNAINALHDEMRKAAGPKEVKPSYVLLTAILEKYDRLLNIDADIPTEGEEDDQPLLTDEKLLADVPGEPPAPKVTLRDPIVRELDSREQALCELVEEAERENTELKNQLGGYAQRETAMNAYEDGRKAAKDKFFGHQKLAAEAVQRQDYVAGLKHLEAALASNALDSALAQRALFGLGVTALQSGDEERAKLYVGLLTPIFDRSVFTLPQDQQTVSWLYRKLNLANPLAPLPTPQSEQRPQSDSQ